MNRIHFIVGAAALFTAVFVAVAITFREPPLPTTVADSDRGISTNRAKSLPAPQFGSAERRRSVERTESSNRRAAQKPGTSTTTPAARPFKVSVPENLISQATPEQKQELITAARRVEVQARGELASLSRQFDLTPAQERKIFPLLVQAATDYQPGFISGGGGAPVPIPIGEEIEGTTVAVGDDGDILETPDAVEDAIYNELEPDQQEAMVDAAIDNQLWWSEIVDQLEDDLDSAVDGMADLDSAEPASPSATDEPVIEAIRTEENGAPTTPDRGNIFDLLD